MPHLQKLLQLIPLQFAGGFRTGPIPTRKAEGQPGSSGAMVGHGAPPMADASKRLSFVKGSQQQR